MDTYVPASGSVLDPFCGGGAVVVEAVRSGREGVGRDINDLAVLVSWAKSKYIDAESIARTGKEVNERARCYIGPPISFEKSTNVHFWFKDYMLTPLTALKISIDSISSHDLRTLLQVIFSATVRSVSLTYRNEVRLRRMSAQEQERFNPDVFDVFAKYLNLAKERIPTLPVGAHADVKKEDVRVMSFEKDAFDAIICSPPYGDERNGVNYTQFAKNMLYWLGFTSSQLRASKDLTLGWGKSERSVPPSKTLKDDLEKLRDNPVAVHEATAFYADYYEALHQLARVARHKIIIVIGNRVLQSHVIDNPQITAELMAEIGIPLQAVHFRKLPTKRLPKMREFGAAIDREGILVFGK
jgi:23S rRNA G2445 N2-methylase RlmL